MNVTRRIAAVALLASLSGFSAQAAPPPPLAAASLVDLATTTTIRAQLRPRRHAVLSAAIAGRLSHFPVQVGQQVRKGTSLVDFDCREEAAERAVINARLEAAQTKHQVNERLAEMQNVSKLEVGLSLAEVRVAEAELQRIKALLDKCRLRAPFAGTVVEKFVQAHHYVAPGEPMLRLVDTAALEIEAVVPAAWLQWLKPGMAFQLRIENSGATVNAAVARIVGEVDPVSQTVKMIGTPESVPADLLPGMSGILEIGVP